jgi:MoxR-like ATPase
MNHIDHITVKETAELSAKIIQEVEKAVIGKTGVHKHMMAAFLSSTGHILLEDYPGLAKTLIASSFAEALGMDFKRIQFTPDLLPGDITGGYVFDSEKNKFTLRKGPIFTQILLADEINRASPKTQSALLEAMQENHVTLEGETLPLPKPFIVIATQNPIEYEGTFPLPEAQLDRFIIKLSIGYPTPAEESEILRRRAERKNDEVELQHIINPDILYKMRECVENVFVDPDVRDYMIKLVTVTRKYSKVVVGSSPRGSIALLKLSRAWAAIHGRDYVTPDDVKQFSRPALAHRILLDPSLWDIRESNNKIIREIEETVAVPVFREKNEK